MKLRSLISPLALAAAMAISAPAFAQTMVGGFEVSADDMGRVQEACAALAASQTQSLAGDKATTEGTDAEESAQSNDPDPAAVENIDQLLTSLTIEQCQDANLASADVAVSGDAMAAAPMSLSATDQEVIDACTAVRARATESAAGDKETTEGNSPDESAQSTNPDPASKEAQISALTVEQCTALGL